MSPDLEPIYITGLTHLREGRINEALAALRDVSAGDPTHAGARRNLIRALLAAGDHAAVVAETGLALRDAPESAELWFQRGTSFNALGRPIDAREALTACVERNPAFAPGWLNLGNALIDLEDAAAAETHCRRALSLDPDLIEAHISLGFILTFQGRLPEAIAVLEGAVRAAPQDVRAHWNLATAALLAGDLPRGFAEYEWRKRHDRFRQDFIDLPGPVWDGGDPRGRTILIHAEQGFGDTVQFARYLPLIARRGGTPILACEPPLIRFLGTLPGVRAVSKFDPLPRYDAWIDQMSLPRVFGTTLRTIPLAAGYWRSCMPIEPASRSRPRRPPGGAPARRIGLAWRGNPSHRNDSRRTPPREVFAPLIKCSGLELVSLVPDETLPGVTLPSSRLTDYAETAALIGTLDLVISVDTSVAHAAGALGCPGWILLPFAADWRWLRERSDTPWYDSLRLFRQPAPGDWHSVIGEVIASLGFEREDGERGQGCVPPPLAIG